MYRSILENCFTQLNYKGNVGLVHPFSVFDDPKGNTFRKEIYTRVQYLFHFINELNLFQDIDHHNSFCVCIYSHKKAKINFGAIFNLFSPNTIEGVFVDNGFGDVEGLKIKEGEKYKWNVKPHKERFLTITEEVLKLLNEVFDGSNNWDETKLSQVHSSGVIEALKAFSGAKTKIGDLKILITDLWNETTHVNSGVIKKCTFQPESLNQLIYSSPNFFILNPFLIAPTLI